MIRLFLSLALVALPAMSMAAPNVLFVIADDMGVDISPCYAQGAKPKMPVLESLCRSGMVFDQAWAAPTCSPTRAMVMTGLYPSQSGVGGAISPKNPVGVATNTTSLFDRLKSSAPQYRTAVIGKWHISAAGRDFDHPAKLGVSYYRGLFSGGVKDYNNWRAVVDGRRQNIRQYATRQITDWGIEWITAQRGKPWFLWLAYNAPHSPFHKPPNELHDQNSLSDSPQSIRRAPHSYYFAALQALDTELGRLLHSLPSKERANTIVVFLGDNGTPGQVVRRLNLKTGAKGDLYAGGIHVPLIIAGPGIAKGRSDTLITASDLHATLLSLMGVKDPQLPSSVSFAHTLATGKESARKAAVSAHFSKAEIKRAGTYGWSITDGSYTLVQPVNGAPQLFKGSATPNGHDLLKRNDPTAAQIANRLTHLRKVMTAQR